MADAAPWLIPQTVYVGDRARLLAPLAWFSSEDRTCGAVPVPPGEEDIVIHRVKLEQWGGEPVLVVEFTSYATGVLEFPPLELEGLLYEGLRAEIASVLNNSPGTGPEKGDGQMALSGLAPPLAVPGTSSFVYGVLAGIMAVFLVSLGGRLWVRRYLKAMLLRRRRRRLIASMGRIGRRIGNSPGSPRSPDFLRGRLDYLCGEFRTFLGLFTMKHCQSMTAGELGEISALVSSEYPGAPVLGGAFLGSFFRRCDDLRYGGGGISDKDLRDILENLRLFLGTLDRAERAGALDPGEPAAGRNSPEAEKNTAEAGS
jgi:hypothetical protein